LINNDEEHVFARVQGATPSWDPGRGQYLRLRLSRFPTFGELPRTRYVGCSWNGL
jgi:hypothetical protein